jgi:hypothetical protein
MPIEVKAGQKWATWVSSRHQWLLATVLLQDSGKATLKYDTRYGSGVVTTNKRLMKPQC